MKRTLLVMGGMLMLSACCRCPMSEITVSEKTGEAIQNAIDCVSGKGGGRVIVPSGIYPTKSLRLRSNVELHLASGCVIRGSTRSEDYFAFPSDVCSIRPERSSRVFLYAWDAENIAVTGVGVIDGQGPMFFDQNTVLWGRFWAKPACERPRLAQFVRCKGVRLEGVTFRDSPNWTMLIRLCSDVLVKGVTIHNNQKMVNSDGIDFDGCRHVRVAQCDFTTGDDCIIARAMREKGSSEQVVCEDMLVEDCEFDSACQVIRMGCPSDDTIRNIRFRNIRAKGLNGIYFNNPARYLREDDEGFLDISDCRFENFTGDLTGSAIQIDVEPGIKLRGVKDILFKDFNVTSAKPLRFVGNIYTRFENVRFDNVTVNGTRQPDGPVPSDCTAAGSLKRTKSGSWELKR